MQTIVNLGTGGADLNGQNGSTTSADSNDALFLDWPGDNGGNYVYLPGTPSVGLTVPDSAALDVTEIDIRCHIEMDSWPATATTNFYNRNHTSGNLQFDFAQIPDGRLRLRYSIDGTTTAAIVYSTVAAAPSTGTSLHLRSTLDPATGNVDFYTSTDGLSWSQLGATVAGTGAVTLASVTSVAYIGYQSGAYMTGKVYRVVLVDGGTTVLDVDCSQISSGSDTSFTALTGQTVSINRSTSGRKSVAVVSPVWLFGTDDHMEVADNDLLDFGASDSFTVLAVVRQWATPTSYGVYVSHFDSTTLDGYELRNYSTSLYTRNDVRDGTTSVLNADAANTYTAGALNSLTLVADRDTDTVLGYVNGIAGSTSSISAVGAVDPAQPLRIGRSASGANTYPQDFELVAVAVFRRALTAAEIAAVTSYYQARLS